MNTELTIANIVSAAIFGLGALVLWPSRKNIPAWLALPPFVISIIIPILVVDYNEQHSFSEIVNYTLINVAGALPMLVGMLLGGMIFKVWQGQTGVTPLSAIQNITIEKRVYKVLLYSNLTLIFCFAYMGFLPVFAENPLLAKFFRGEYRDRYIHIAVFYRFAQTMLAAALPLAIAAFWDRRSKPLLLLIVMSISIFAMALTRGTAFQGLLLVISAAVCTTRTRLSVLMVFLVGVYGFGSMFFYILGLRQSADFNIWREIAWGAPDISDQLLFTSMFELAGRPFSWGLTFIGGLVPGNFQFNPAVFTLSIANQTDDISDIASGGFRLSPPIYGYMAFSWVGAILVPFVSGFLTAWFVKKFKRSYGGTVLSRVGAIQVFLGVYSFYINFYMMSYGALVALVSILFMLNGLPFRKGLILLTRRPSRKVTRTAG